MNPFANFLKNFYGAIVLVASFFLILIGNYLMDVGIPPCDIPSILPCEDSLYRWGESLTIVIGPIIVFVGAVLLITQIIHLFVKKFKKVS